MDRRKLQNGVFSKENSKIFAVRESEVHESAAN
jgi:hypothetical protein